MKTSWKTTTGGLIALLGASLFVVPDDAPGAVFLKPWAPFLSAFGTGIIGLCARDHKVTSEQAGAVKK